MLLLLSFFTLITGPRRSLSLKLSDTRVYEPQIRTRLGTAAHLCKAVVLKLCVYSDWLSDECKRVDCMIRVLVCGSVE